MKKVIKSKFRVKSFLVIALVFTLTQFIIVAVLYEPTSQGLIKAFVYGIIGAILVYWSTRREKIELTDEYMSIKNGLMPGIRIEKARIRSFEKREAKRVERFLGFPKEVIAIHYNTYDDGIIQTTDPAILIWLEEATNS
ncbi:MAG: hypothetical protein HWE14_03265 [Flavobacteriia bacterium]|nr:hypothetical protein [Flavobacteriia bacterium]